MDRILTYKKRDGTSGIEGKLYETKLITLLRIRSFVDEYDEFYLGTNLDDIGALDDICVRYKQNDEDIIVFLQAKHRTDVTKGKLTTKTLWAQTGDFSLSKYFSNYLNVRERFNDTKNKDVMFHGEYEDLKRYFVIYTSAGNELKHKITTNDRFIDKSVRDLIQSGGELSDVFQYRYADDEVDSLSKAVLVEEMECLGKSLFSYIKKNKFDFMLCNDYIRKYHVVLARSVINVSDANSTRHRTGTFRDNFINSNDQLLLALKKGLFIKAIEGIQVNKDNVKELVQVIVFEPTAINISQLMLTVPIRYEHKTNTLAITNKNVKDIADALSKVKIRYKVYEEAFDIASKEKLNSTTFKLPTMFGNFDIAVSDGKKGTRRLEYLAEQLEKIMLHFQNKIVIINKDLIGSNRLIHDGVMDINGGLGSAVGNLLVSSEDDVSFKFNVINCEILGKNAKKLLELLKSKSIDLDTYRLKIEVEGFPKLSMRTDARHRKFAIDFFNNLWFYTNQAKEDEIIVHARKTLKKYCTARKNDSDRLASCARYDAIYFKMHNEVQQWWMSKGKSYYLTNDRNFFYDDLKEFLENSLLNILGSVYVKRIKNCAIEFNRIAVRTLCTEFGSDCTVIVTDAITLTGIKLVQHFQTLNDYAFIELDSPVLLSGNDSNALKEEIKNQELQTLITIYEVISEYKSELFRYILKETPSKQLIILTNTHSLNTILSMIMSNREFVRVSDTRTEFSDLVPTSQRKVLSSKLMFQGTEVTFNDIIQEDATHLIRPHLLQKIVSNEIIEVGRLIFDPNYEEIKYYYVDRQLSIKDESDEELLSKVNNFNKLKSFEFINDTVVLIGTSGAGKSTFLTRMSIETKQRNPAIWIERINLLDYTKEFYRWQENKIKIDRIEALKFVCKSAMSKIILRNNINYNLVEIDIEIISGELILKNLEPRNSLIGFELEIFISCYNRGNTVLLFDGFDEICPHYEEKVTELLKCLVTRGPSDNLNDGPSHKQRMWITSRPYTNIISTLQTEFGTTYDLQELTLKELKIAMMKFFKVHLSLHELNYDQFTNVDGFIKYMQTDGEIRGGQKKMNIIKYYNFILHELYFTAAEYILNEAKHVNPTSEKYSFVEKWLSRGHINYKIPLFDFFRVIKINYNNILRRKQAMMFTVTPLHMYVALDYFTNKIKNITSDNTTMNVPKWDLEANMSTFYQHFLETQFKKRRFEQKNQMDLFNPDNILIYETKRKEFLDTHKKLAFYATYINKLEDILTQDEIDEMRNIITEFEAAKEKTGVVDYIIDGLPKFIHLTFQEYLAAEYITDLFKRKPEEYVKLRSFIIGSENTCVLEFIGFKLECDSELKSIFEGDVFLIGLLYAIINEDTRHMRSMQFVAKLLEESDESMKPIRVGFNVAFILIVICFFHYLFLLVAVKDDTM